MAKIYDFKTKELIYEHKEDTSKDHYQKVLTEINAFYHINKTQGLTLEIIQHAIPWFEEYSLIAMTEESREKAKGVVKYLKKEISEAKKRAK